MSSTKRGSSLRAPDYSAKWRVVGDELVADIERTERGDLFERVEKFKLSIPVSTVMHLPGFIYHKPK